MFEASHLDTTRSDWAVWAHHSYDYLVHLIRDVWGENPEHYDIREVA